MEKPSPTLSRVMVAVVSNFCAVMPAPPSCAESAMVKQPAWAAASSSSGLVPMPLSKREWKEYGVCLRTLLSVERVPLPAFRSPCQTADALRCMMFLLHRKCLNDLNLPSSIRNGASRVYSHKNAKENQTFKVRETRPGGVGGPWTTTGGILERSTGR